MKLPPYPKYKPSRVEWLGDVPEHWEVKAARLAYSIQLGKMLQPEARGMLDSEVPYLKSQHVQWETVRTTDLPTMWASLVDEAKYGVADGDLLVCEGGDVGRAGIVRNPPSRTIIQNALHRVRPVGANDSRLLMYVLEHAADQSWFEILCNRSTIAHFTGEKFGALRIPVPPPSEQRAIAEFLDRETAKIDTLVIKKSAFINRLNEKRNALISRTVTCGLPLECAADVSHHTKFKSSGVGSLSEVPSSWRVTRVWLERVRRSLEYQDGNHGELHPTTEDYVGDGIPFVMANNLVDGKIDFDSCRYIEKELADSLRIGFARTGDVLLTHKGTIGRVGMVQDNRFPYVMLTPQVTYYRCLSGIAARYLFWSFQGKYWQDQMALVSSLGTTRGYVGLLDQRYLVLVLPPFEEQIAISEFLDDETEKIDRMISKVETAIERLQEYRSALITATVTGKIDVSRAEP